MVSFWDDASYETIQQIPGVTAVGMTTGASRTMGGVSYPLEGYAGDYLALRGLELTAGRWPEASDEVLVGVYLQEYLGERLTLPGLSGEVQVTVSGVLTPAFRDAGFGSDANTVIFIPLSRYPNPRFGDTVLVATTAEAFAEVGEALRDLIGERGLDEAYEVTVFSEQFTLILRQRLAQVLGGALSFGVIAIAIVAVVNLMAFFYARALSRLRQLGIRRAVGAKRRQLVVGELLAVLPWTLAGLIPALLLTFLLTPWFADLIGTPVSVGLWSLVGMALGLFLIVLLASLAPVNWLVRVPPLVALRGVGANLPQRRLVLAGAGITLGVAGLLVQGGLSRGAQLETERLLGVIGDRIGIYGTGIRSSEDFADQRIPSRVEQADYIALLSSPVAEQFSRVGYGRAHVLIPMTGPAGSLLGSLKAIEGDYLELASPQLIHGRAPTAREPEMMIGQRVATELFGREDVVGESLALFGRNWSIVGVFTAGEQGFTGGLNTSYVVVSARQFRVREGGFGSILVEVAPGYDVDATLEAGADVLSSRYDLTRHMPFQVARPNDYAVHMRESLDRLMVIFGLLAGLLFVLGASGLAAQLLVSVSLRVREIGITRALGAHKKHIFAAFVQEALQLGILATLLGLIAGTALVTLVAAQQGIPSALPLTTVVLAVGAALLIVLLSCVVPSLMAAQQPPMLAMQEREA
jgi:putative ABC transport system permease protein